MTEKCPKENEACKYFDSDLGCHSSIHHQWWPRRAYMSGNDKKFRELPEHKEKLCRAEHDELHAREKPPEKPPIEVILAALGIRRAS